VENRSSSSELTNKLILFPFVAEFITKFLSIYQQGGFEWTKE